MVRQGAEKLSALWECWGLCFETHVQRLNFWRLSLCLVHWPLAEHLNNDEAFVCCPKRRTSLHIYEREVWGSKQGWGLEEMCL